MRTLLAVLAAAPAIWAQTGGAIEAPALGLVFDRSTGTVRAISGVPGAATLGAAVGGAELEAAAVAANAGYALAIGRDGSAAVITRAGARPLGGGNDRAVRAIVSPRGTAAAIVRLSGLTQVFTGMPDAPSAVRTVDAGGTPLALSDDGEVLLAMARSRREGDTVYAHRAEAAQAIYRARRIAAAAFLPGGQRALIAEAATAKIVSPDLGVEPAGADPDGDIVAVAASPDGNRVFLASRTGRVTIHDLRSGEAASAMCPCAPQTLAPLRGNAVFRLNEAGDGPVWILDADAGEARVHFVAAGGGVR